jgi:ABC-type transport system substrate-binding protein
MFPPGSYAYRDDFPRYDYNLTKAQEEFSKASPEIQEKVLRDGIRFTYSEGQGVGKEAALMLKEELEKIGIELKIEEIPYATWVDYCTSVNQPRFEIMGATSSADMDDPANFAQYYTTETWPPKGYRGDFRGSPETDILWQEAARELDPVKRKEMYWQIEQIFYENASVLYCYAKAGAGLDFNVQGKWVKGFVFNILSSVHYSMFYYLWKEPLTETLVTGLLKQPPSITCASICAATLSIPHVHYCIRKRKI